LKIGRTTDISLVEARSKVMSYRANIALHGDPNGEAAKQSTNVTYSEFMEKHYLPYVETRKRSANRDEQLYRIHVKARFGDTLLDKIKRKDIEQLHTDVFALGYKPATVDHVVKLMRHSLFLTVDWEMLEKNPASRIPLFNEDNKVENFLSDAQLRDLLLVLKTDHNRPVCAILMFLLSTGARLQEALDASWSQMDLEHRMWRIPAKGTKAGKTRAVPLNDSAMELLIAGRNNGSEACFPNPKTGKPYVTITRVWHRIRGEAGISNFRIHDLRHSYASFMANSGRSLYEIQQLLGHADSRVTQRYSHLTSKTLHEASSTVADKIKAAS
jgi:integrase